MTTLVVGDLGGTNSRLTVLEYSEGIFTEGRSEVLQSKEYSSFRMILHKFLDGYPVPSLGIFAVAGVAKGDSAFFVNMGWSPTEDLSVLVQEEFSITKVVFLNDFEAAGFGCLELKPDDYIQINPGVEPKELQRKVVMGPGTGLGEAILTWNGTSYSAWPGEGGHDDFAPHDDEQ